MKKLIAVLMIIVLPCMGNAQRSVNPQNVPAKVTKAFNEKYPGQQLKKWKYEDSVYSAIYDNSGIKYTANFSNFGTWLQTSFRISNKNVPETVKIAIRKSKYASWRIDKFERVETVNNPTLYMINVDNSSITGGPDGSNPNDYTDYYNIYILPDGKIIKSELTHM